MSLTIQDCASQSAEERRARRRQRILQNSEQRLTTILSGPDGEEKRQAPSIEGFLGNEESAQKDGVNGEASNMAAANSNDRDPIQFVPPHYNDQVGQQRFWLMILLGLTFRVAAQLGWLDYVLLTFTAMFVVGELIRAIPQLRTYPKHGYLVNMLLISGLNERMVVWIGLTLDLLWDFAVDICLVTFSFICTHLALLLGNAIAAHTPCCSSSTAHQ